MSLHNPDSYQDVHQYDNNIIIPELPVLSPTEKLASIKLLIPKLTDINALRIIHSITNSIINNLDENYDNINNVDASDILAAILKKPYDNIIDILQEQLADIWLLGQCPQGRTIRFIQIYRSLE